MSSAQQGTEADLAPGVALMRLAQGYQISSAIYVAAHLGIADLLRDGPTSYEELAQGTETHAPSLLRLLWMLTAFGLLAEEEPGQFALTSQGAYLVKESPDSLRDAVLAFSSDDFQRSWGDLLHCVQTGESAVSRLYGTPNPFDYYAAHPEVGAVMNAGFASNARLRARAVVAAYDFSATGTLVDVGGGRGLLIATILRQYPQVRGVLFDLPHVVTDAEALLERAGVRDRCALVGGDIFAEIPAGGDTYVLSRIIHDWDDGRAATILQNCARAMGPRTTLLVIERGRPTRIEQSAAAQAWTCGDVNMLVRTGGRERTNEEYRALLDAAGFELVEIIPTESEDHIFKAMLR